MKNNCPDKFKDYLALNTKFIQFTMNYKEICQNVKHLPKDQYFTLLGHVSGQKSFEGIEHSSYHSTFDLKLKVGPKNMRILFKPSQFDFINLYFIDKEYEVFHLQIKHIARYIDENSEKRFLFLPVLYTNQHIRKTHMNCLVIDTQKKEMFIIEPNGTHPLEFINKLMDMLVRDFKRHKPGYKFVPLHQWLLCKRNLNCWTDEDELGGGICATVSIFLAHKLISLGEKEKLNEYIASFTREQAKSEIKDFIHSLKL